MYQLNKKFRLGLYEKAMPNNFSWEEKLVNAKQAGFDFVEISVDETDEKQAIEMALLNLSEVAKGNDKEAIKAAIEQVDKLSQAFAQRRMDQSIKSAFSGQSVDRI